MQHASHPLSENGSELNTIKGNRKVKKTQCCTPISSFVQVAVIKLVYSKNIF
jgi:hypothetical protein